MKFKDVDFSLSQQDVAGLTLCLIERSKGKQIVFRADQGSSLTFRVSPGITKSQFQGENVPGSNF